MKKYYAVVNTKWRDDEWDDPFYEQMMAISGEQIFSLAIFNSKKEAQKFKGDSKEKIVEVMLVTKEDL